MGKNGRKITERATGVTEGDAQQTFDDIPQKTAGETVQTAPTEPMASPEPPEAPARAPPVQSPPVQRSQEELLIEEMRELIRTPKTKNSKMTVSMFTDGQFTTRYFELDVNGEGYRKAWQLFKLRTGTKDHARFLFLVYGILECSPPRLHREVDWVPLD